MQNLKKLAGVENDEYEVVILNGSGSTAMETSIRSLVADDETVLNVSVGAFGDLYHKMAVCNGKKAVQCKFEAGEAIDLAIMEKALQEHSPAVVTFTHNETSTGVVNDIEAVCALVRQYGAMPLVDGVSIFGGADIKLTSARPTMYSTSTQKALGLPAGFGVAFVSKEAEDKASRVPNRGYACDLIALLGRARKKQTTNTPNCTLANQAFVQLDYIVNEEGIENRFARHAKMRDMAHEFVAGLDGFDLFAPEDHRSPTVTAVKVRTGVALNKLKGLKEALRAKGYLFDPGYAKLNTDLEAAGKQLNFRIGHMGDITPDMLTAYLVDLKAALATL